MIAARINICGMMLPGTGALKWTRPKLRLLSDKSWPLRWSFKQLVHCQ